MEIKLCIDDCFELAAIAAQDKAAELAGNWYPCGFAWVNIIGARGNLRKELLACQGIHQNNFEAGLTVWAPSAQFTQSMEIKIAACRAFANELIKHLPKTVRVEVYSRID